MTGRPHRGILVGLLTLVCWTAGVRAADPAARDEVAAKVNGTVIARKAVLDVVRALADAQDEPPSPKQAEQLARDALDSLIAFELLYQEGQRRGLTVGDEEVEAAIATTRARFPSAAAYDEAVKQRGMTTADMQRDMRKTLLVDHLLARTVWHDLTISPDQVRTFYEQNREQFKRPVEVRASHILIRVEPDATPAVRTAAQRSATDVLAKLQAGGDFAALAKTLSQDPATAPKGGDLGFFARGAMEPTFEQAVFVLKVGELSAVVQTPYGYHIIKLTDRRPAGYASESEAEADIKAVIEDEEKRTRQEQLVAELKKQAKVEVLPGLKPPAPKRK